MSQITSSPTRQKAKIVYIDATLYKGECSPSESSIQHHKTFFGLSIWDKSIIEDLIFKNTSKNNRFRKIEPLNIQKTLEKSFCKSILFGIIVCCWIIACILLVLYVKCLKWGKKYQLACECKCYNLPNTSEALE